MRKLKRQTNEKYSKKRQNKKRWEIKKHSSNERLYLNFLQR